MTVEIFTAQAIGFTTDATVTSMLSIDEKALYYDVARSYRGEGGVVEVGPWLGSGTVQICRGLEEAGRPWRLTVIDRFLWSSLYERRYPEIPLKDGESFLPLFRANLGPNAERIDPIASELLEMVDKVVVDRPIELLFVDAPKSWKMLWLVLNHLGPHLVPGARLVFQDFFHITSRQIIWLLASIPQLEMQRLVDSGTAVSFVAREPLVDLERTVAPSMKRLTAEDLVGFWRRLSAILPDARKGELAAGAALDLLDKGADHEAEALLGEGVSGRPWAGAIIKELERLHRFSSGRNAEDLLDMIAFLKAGIPFAASRRQRASKAGPAEAGGLEALDRSGLAAAAAAVAAPRTAAALTLRFAAHHGAPDPRTLALLSPALEAAVGSDAVRWPLEVQRWLPGADVVELDASNTLHGLVMRALGARRYVGVNPQYDAAKRTYTGSDPNVRLRTQLPLGKLAEQDPDLGYVAAASALPPKSADLVLLHPSAGGEDLDGMIADALRLVKPDGVVGVRWRNPAGWAGGWRHVGRLAPGTPRVEDIRRRLGQAFDLKWSAVPAGAEAIIRLDEAVLAGRPGFNAEDLLTETLIGVGRVRSAPAPASA